MFDASEANYAAWRRRSAHSFRSATARRFRALGALGLGGAVPRWRFEVCGAQ